jgi:hypothetical protein
MRGPKPTHPVNLTAEEVKSFQQLILAHSTPQAVTVRARIILRAYDHPEQNNQQIAQAVGTTDRTVRKWGAKAFFPLRCAPKSRPSPVACPSSARCRSRAGVAPN